MPRKDRGATIGQGEHSSPKRGNAVPGERRWWGRGESVSTTGDGVERGRRADRFEDLSRRGSNPADTIEVLVGDADESVAVARWTDRLSRYVEEQGPLDALRLRSSTELPWPTTDNPMVRYLIDRSREIATEDGLDEALASLASNAWFEGVLAERARIARLIDQD